MPSTSRIQQFIENLPPVDAARDNRIALMREMKVDPMARLAELMVKDGRVQAPVAFSLAEVAAEAVDSIRLHAANISSLLKDSDASFIASVILFALQKTGAPRNGLLLTYESVDGPRCVLRMNDSLPPRQALNYNLAAKIASRMELFKRLGGEVVANPKDELVCVIKGLKVDMSSQVIVS